MESNAMPTSASRLVAFALGFLFLCGPAPLHAGEGARLRDERRVVEIGGREDAVHRPANAQPAHERPRVDALDANDVTRLEVRIEFAVRAEVTRHAREFADDEPRDSQRAGASTKDSSSCMSAKRIPSRCSIASLARNAIWIAR